jgi:hypothetical protein
MAGHVGKAFWYSTDTGDFVTSGYYYEEYPEWVTQWNVKGRAAAHAGTTWELEDQISEYRLGKQDDRPYEADLKGYGRTFPHPYGRPEDGLFFTRLFVGPVGDRLTADFAKTLLVSENLGVDSVPDYFSISFSGVDAVNHFFGPSSLEQEAVIRALDRTLADLLAFIDEHVGLRHTLIVLAADHGMADMPEYMGQLGLATGRLTPDEIVDTVNSVGETVFGVSGLVLEFFRPYVYLDIDMLTAEGHDKTTVENAVAKALEEIDGVELAFPASRLAEAHRSPLLDRVRRNHHPARSGDIYVAQAPYWFLFAGGPVVVMHGSPHRYDTHVPIVFSGPGIPAQTVHRRVHPVDVAPTIAALLGVGSPALARGTELPEVFQALQGESNHIDRQEPE